MNAANDFSALLGISSGFFRFPEPEADGVSVPEMALDFFVLMLKKLPNPEEGAITEETVAVVTVPDPDDKGGIVFLLPKLLVTRPPLPGTPGDLRPPLAWEDNDDLEARRPGPGLKGELGTSSAPAVLDLASGRLRSFLTE